MKRLLIVVDPQNDFVSPMGTLSVPNAETAIPNINRLLQSDKFTFRVITQDWHPCNHVSFADTHGAEKFTEKETLQAAGRPGGIKTVRQVMWPIHCVAGTSGAAIHSQINIERVDAIFRKGVEPDCECYSIFEYVFDKSNKVLFGDEYITSYFNMIDSLKFDEIVVCGFATDYCVEATAISARRLCENVSVIIDAAAPVAPDNIHKTYSRLTLLKVALETTAEYLGE